MNVFTTTNIPMLMMHVLTRHSAEMCCRACHSRSDQRRVVVSSPIPGTERIEVTLLADQEVMATMDGQIGVGLKEQDTVEVRKGAARIRLVHFPHKDFFSVLRTKLKWGER